MNKPEFRRIENGHISIEVREYEQIINYFDQMEKQLEKLSSKVPLYYYTDQIEIRHDVSYNKYYTYKFDFNSPNNKLYDDKEIVEELKSKVNLINEKIKEYEDLKTENKNEYDNKEYKLNKEKQNNKIEYEKFLGIIYAFDKNMYEDYFKTYSNTSDYIFFNGRNVSLYSKQKEHCLELVEQYHKKDIEIKKLEERAKGREEYIIKLEKKLEEKSLLTKIINLFRSK